MKLYVIIPLWALLTFTQQASALEICACELNISEKAFPHEKLRIVETNVSDCNSNITPQKTVELESLLLGLEHRLSQLNKDVLILEKEDDGELYGVLSLYVIENEMTEIKQLIDKLNSTMQKHQILTANATKQLENLKTEMQELEKFDTMQVIKGQQAIAALKVDLRKCSEKLNTTVAPTEPPQGYPYTDLDLATDESGVWVVYTTTQDFGNLVLSKLEEGEPPTLRRTWRTSVYKRAVTNTFMACGVLYATRYINREVEEIFYSFNTVTGQEKFNIGIFMNKMSPNIQSLNYSPVDQMLHAYCDSNMVSYKVLFG
ncbi:adhesion G protein-coupled receptor L3-like [Neolamprologus brichardi]|uniref:adhesion G protein-coupled receptor L3-like n=1 Tax=Neolamprologus brichardi TaxID=32507 RepID=UPI0003EC0A9C|nr:adhesion G protein-coupled receptor L3-like [Neolamprologus brichardi]